MLTINNIAEIAKFLESFENPIAWVVGGVVAAFFIWRKFNNSEYVTAGKEQLASLTVLCNSMKDDHDRIKKEHDALKIEFRIIEDQLDECRCAMEILKKRLEAKACLHKN